MSQVGPPERPEATPFSTQPTEGAPGPSYPPPQPPVSPPSYGVPKQAALYPLAANVLGDASLVTRALGAHSEMKVQIDLIRHLEGPPLVAAFQSLQEMVTMHVNDEEQNLLPALRARATAGQLDGLAARIEQAKQRVG